MENTVKPNKTFKIKLHSTVEDALKCANRENAKPGKATQYHGEVLAWFTCNELVYNYDEGEKRLRVFYVLKCEDGATLVNELTSHSCMPYQPLRVVFPDLENEVISVSNFFINKDREGRKWFASLNGVAGTDSIGFY